MIPRLLLTAIVLASALLLEGTVLALLPLPGATPDLVLVAVVALALAYGPAAGAVAGFAGGLGLDVLPPGDYALGRWALVLCLAGYAIGTVRDVAARSVFLPPLVVALAAAGTGLLSGGLGLLVGDGRVTWALLAALLPTAVLYDVVLAAVVLPGVLGLARRLEPGLFRH